MSGFSVFDKSAVPAVAWRETGGFKLHLVFVRRATADNVNEQGELLNLQITPGNIDDRKPVPDLLKSLFGKVFAERGYVCASLAQISLSLLLCISRLSTNSD